MKSFKKLEEVFVERDDLYRGAVLHFVKDTVRLPNGELATREICLHPGAVCIIPILDDGTVIMEHQYRYALSRVFFEIPAGKLDFVGEDPLEAAKRELREETGAVAQKFTFLGDLVTSPAIVSEKIKMYLAEDITFDEQELDEDEFLELERVPLKQLYGMVLDGKIADAKTQIAILKAAKLRPQYLK